MSWCLSVKGTKEHCERALEGAKLNGAPSAAARAGFDAARAKALDLMSVGLQPTDPVGHVVFDIRATGRGVDVDSLSLSFEAK